MTMIIVVHEPDDLLMLADSRMGYPPRAFSPVVPKVHVNDFCALGVTFGDGAFSFLGRACPSCGQPKPEHWMDKCSGLSSLDGLVTAVESELHAEASGSTICLPVLGLSPDKASFQVRVLSSTGPAQKVSEGGYWMNPASVHYAPRLIAALSSAPAGGKVAACLDHLAKTNPPLLLDPPQWTRWVRDDRTGKVAVESRLYDAEKKSFVQESKVM